MASNYAEGASQRQLTAHNAGKAPRAYRRLPTDVSEWDKEAVEFYFSRPDAMQNHPYFLIFGWSDLEGDLAFALVEDHLEAWANKGNPLDKKLIPRVNQPAANVFDREIYDMDKDLFQPYWIKNNTARPDWAIHGLLRQDRPGESTDKTKYDCYTATMNFTTYVKGERARLAKIIANGLKRRRSQSRPRATSTSAPLPSVVYDEDEGNDEGGQNIQSAPLVQSVINVQPAVNIEETTDAQALSSVERSASLIQSRIYDKEDFILHFTNVTVTDKEMRLAYIARVGYRTACNNSNTIDYDWLASNGIWKRNSRWLPFSFDNGTAFSAGSGLEMAAAVHVAWLGDSTRPYFDFFIAQDKEHVQGIPQDYRKPSASRKEEGHFELFEIDDGTRGDDMELGDK